jgi:hypothetical protein
MRIRIWDQISVIFLTLDQGSGMEKIRIRDKHPGSATLLTPIWQVEPTYVMRRGVEPVLNRSLSVEFIFLAETPTVLIHDVMS